MILKALPEKCSGCRTCCLACAIENFREINPSKSLLRIEGRFPAPGDYRIQLCDQCGACAENCPEEAIHLEKGVYIVDQAACTGFLTCVEVCPRDVMFEQKGSDVPAKCILCGECARTCPRDAIVVSNRRPRLNPSLRRWLKQKIPRNELYNIKEVR